MNNCPDANLNIQPVDGGSSAIQSPICVTNFSHFVTTGIQILLIVASVAALFMIIWGGIRYITSAGDPEGVANAKAHITYAVVGLAISFLSLAIFQIIGHVIGLDLLF